MPIDVSGLDAPPRRRAVDMLSAGLDRLKRDQGVTQREVAQALGYKGSVVLSHMASGRVPIPVERASDLAAIVGLDRQQFTLAVLEQRYPNLNLKELLGVTLPSRDQVAERLELLAGRALDDLDLDTVAVLEEVVAAKDPRRRWLSLDELAGVERMRAEDASP